MDYLQHDQARPVSIKRQFFSAPTLLSFGIAAGFIFFLTTRFDLDWGATWDNVRAMNPWLYLLGFILYYLSFVFRGMRWRILARNAGAHPAAGTRLPSVFRSSQLILIGWFVNSIAWLRLGDAYRAYAFSEDSRGSFSWSLGTVLAERVLDMATVFSLLLVGAIFLTMTSDSAVSDYLLVAGFIMALVLQASLLLMRIYGTKMARFLPGRLEVAYHRFHQGALGSFKQLPIIIFLGFTAWLLEMARLYFVIQALDLSIDLALVPVVALGHAILSTVPSPGGIGAVEPGVTGLLLVSLERDSAVSVTVVDRSITYVSVIIIGGLVFLLRQVTQARQHRQQVTATRQLE